MPRGSGGGGGRSSSRPAARSRPRRQTVSHVPKPAPVPASGGSSFLGSIATNMAEALTWGAGNAMGHRAMERILGPRTVHVEMVNSVAAQPELDASSVADACGIHSKAFQDCLNNYGTDISRCQFYIDMLSECKRNSGAMSA